MYTPKKGWMRWKKIIKQNLISNIDGEIVYKLGEHHWGRHCVIYGNLIDMDYEAVAATFPITHFKNVFAYISFYGMTDSYGEFPFLDRESDSYARSPVEMNLLNVTRRAKKVSKLYKEMELCGAMEEFKKECIFLENGKTLKDVLLETEGEYDE